MDIETIVPKDFDRATFDSLSTESQCKVLALYEVAYLLDRDGYKPITPKEFYTLYELDPIELYDTCTGLINAIQQGNIPAHFKKA
jgi:hypothetical protein